jgi:hypothetical protein
MIAKFLGDDALVFADYIDEEDGVQNHDGQGLHQRA